ncbi:hypothetical protein H310_04838 [Aphanomyces invadans]|uniref:Uncharacterized protein n=1 Tax=Aphanomyces invadans TaxID=157072 RepID=A0A024UBU3_9STRA|nr:hypothetical protein H310_04838 [Aphanomyces invadans]ETW03347.1 hypothetical protein H310_04838 [Aphanomyces invadans]|eukprot:XP_008867576.1 hypothetical protein H310_04838 [Aphanomyces invadans]
MTKRTYQTGWRPAQTASIWNLESFIRGANRTLCMPIVMHQAAQTWRGFPSSKLELFMRKGSNPVPPRVAQRGVVYAGKRRDRTWSFQQKFRRGRVSCPTEVR